LDNVFPGVTVIDVSISESVELGLVENADGLEFVEEVGVGDALFLVVIDVFVGLVFVVVVVFVGLVGLVVVVLVGLVVVFAVVRVVDVDVIVVIPNALRFEPFLIILSLVEVGCGARLLLPAVFSFSSSSEDFLVFSAQIPYVAPLQVCLTVYLVPFGHAGMVWRTDRKKIHLSFGQRHLYW